MSIDRKHPGQSPIPPRLSTQELPPPTPPPMPPKGQPSKADLAKKQKVVEDKTFGLKNKNKSKNVQRYVQNLQQSVQPKPDLSKIAVKKKKEEEKAREKELKDLFKIAVSQPKVPVVCEFYKVGQCQKGFKCKFSHDLNVQRKGEKIYLYSDKRDQETMEDWDQETLEKVVETKNKEYNQNKPTDIELASLWEKMRRYNVGNEERSKLVSQALQKMNDNYLEIAGSHVLGRVLQTCVKYCTQEERDFIFDALRPHLLALSCKKYAVHLVKKILDQASKKQLEWFISSLHGHVTSLLRHSVGSAVVDYVFHLASGSQKQSLLVEMYSTELQLFKDLTLTNSGRLVDIISRLQLQKSSVVRHMYSILQSLIEKGIVNHSIIHKAILEFFTIADKSSAADVIQQLLPLLVQDSPTEEENPQIPAPEKQKKRKIKSKNVKEPLLARMVQTRDGLKICIICVKHATAKERKKIIKGMKGHIGKLSLDQFGSLLLVCALSVLDDTKLLTKIVIQELQMMLKELVLDKNGRRMILQLLHPHSSQYFAPEDLVCLNLSVASLCEQVDETKDLSEINQVPIKQGENLTDNNEKEGRIVQSATGSKKDSFRRRHELLVESGLAEGLSGICIDNVGELLCSNFGKDVVYELAVGGSDGILQSFTDRTNALHEAIVSLAVLPKTNETEEEHVFENFYSSRLIRKLVLNSPIFATTLWKMALEGKCDIWALGHSSKILHAFLQSSVSAIQDLAKPELQLLMDREVLKAPESKLTEKAAGS